MKLDVLLEEEKDVKVLNIFLNFDVINFKILEKFYFTPSKFPSDTNCYYLQQLFSELKTEGIDINLETLRKRLEGLVKLGLIEKVKTYPRIYMPVRNVKKVKEMLNEVKSLFL